MLSIWKYKDSKRRNEEKEGWEQILIPLLDQDNSRNTFSQLTEKEKGCRDTA